MPNFENLYRQELASSISGMGAERRVFGEKRKKRVRTLMVLVVILSVVASVVSNNLFDSFGIALITFFSALTVGYLGVDHLVKMRLKKRGLGALQERFKKEVIHKVVQLVNPDFNYQPSGTLNKEILLRSQLLDIKRNTTIKVDDVISGSWKGHQVAIANVIMRSRLNSDRRKTANDSVQGFNGLLVEVKKEVPGVAFVVPKSKMQNSISSLTSMKFKRDPNMSMAEQKAYNMQMMSQGMNMDFTWAPYMSALAKDMNERDLNADSKKPYKVFCDSEGTFLQISGNEKLQRLLSDSFVDQQALQELADTKSFQLLDNKLLDSVVRTTLTYAVHSGSVWVLIPGWQDKFELLLDQEITKRTVENAYDDLRLSLASIEPFL